MIFWQDVMDAEMNEILDGRHLIKVRIHLQDDLEIGTKVVDVNQRQKLNRRDINIFILLEVIEQTIEISRSYIYDRDYVSWKRRKRDGPLHRELTLNLG